MNKVTVTTNSFNYDVLINNNLINEVKKQINLINLKYSKVVVITDKNVEALYIEHLKVQFPEMILISINPGEESKSLTVVEKIYYTLIQNNITRNDLIIAFGGGVVGDLAGYVASTYMRGIKWINIPTTLLSQVDSSVGGKVAVNLDSYKNIIGSFYQPKMVLIDPTLLNTLPKRELNAGLVEMIKIFLLRDKLTYYTLKNEAPHINISKFIYQAVKLKRDIVLLDPYEQNIRMILNFGHTIGHALESYFNYEKYNHGEAVGIGIACMVKNNQSILNEVLSLYKLFDLDADLPKIDYDEFLKIVMKDKKCQSDDKIKIVLLHEIGSSYIREIKIKSLLEYLT